MQALLERVLHWHATGTGSGRSGLRLRSWAGRGLPARLALLLSLLLLLQRGLQRLLLLIAIIRVADRAAEATLFLRLWLECFPDNGSRRVFRSREDAEDRLAA